MTRKRIRGNVSHTHSKFEIRAFTPPAMTSFVFKPARYGC